MSKGLLADKISQLRRSKGLSQEELASRAAINLRTLQRIETGKTEPRGQTLRLIGQALDTPLEELLEGTKVEDSGFLQLLNLSALSFWVIPLGNLFIPTVLWVLKKDKVQGVQELGRRLLNFQLTWSFLTYGFTFLTLFSGLLQLPLAISPLLILPGILLLCLLNSGMILLASSQLRRGREKVYSISLPILR